VCLMVPPFSLGGKQLRSGKMGSVPPTVEAGGGQLSREGLYMQG
jgi:hypothetical protein